MLSLVGSSGPHLYLYPSSSQPYQPPQPATILNMAQTSGNIMQSVTMDTGDASAGFYPYGMDGPSGPPASRFVTTVNQLATQDLPNIELLARNALEGINRAYAPDTDPAKTAADLRALRTGLRNLYDMLKETGVGAIPLDAENGEFELNGGSSGSSDRRMQALTEQVNTVFKEGKAARERATVVLDMLQESDRGPSQPS